MSERTHDEDHEELAGKLGKRADELGERSEELEDEIENARREAEARRQEDAVADAPSRREAPAPEEEES